MPGRIHAPTGGLDDGAALAVPVREAATVMVVRDGADGLEVLMLRRSLASTFVGGAYVFPGGMVDPHDRDPAVAARCDGLTPSEADEALAMSDGMASWIAAVRECFEEAGVLLAHDRSGAVVSLADPDDVARFDAYRRAVHAGTTTLLDVLEAEDLRIAADRIHYWGHWVTPVGPPRRYDTRFFVCAAPPEQVSFHDEIEMIDSIWTTPAEALARNHRDEITLIFPTYKSLEAIGRFTTTAELLAAASQRGAVPAILPQLPGEP